MRVQPIAIATALGVATVAGLTIPGHGQAPDVTAFEGARIIVGDGRTIENGTIVMEGAKTYASRNKQRCSGARWRHAREPRGQNRDAGDGRHSCPSQSHARRPRDRFGTAGVLRRECDDEPRPG